MYLTEAQQKANCLKLADILEQHVTDEQFDMGDYGRASHCGTVGCALGWGAMSGQIEGLGYSARRYKTEIYVTDLRDLGDNNVDIQPVVLEDGRATKSSWTNVGEEFFGYAANQLFSQGRHESRARVAARLREIAAR